jgi:hypothetical protein
MTGLEADAESGATGRTRKGSKRAGSFRAVGGVTVTVRLTVRRQPGVTVAVRFAPCEGGRDRNAPGFSPTAQVKPRRA